MRIQVTDAQTGQVIAPWGTTTADASGNVNDYAPVFTVSCYWWSYDQLQARALDVPSGQSWTATARYSYPGVCY